MAVVSAKFALLQTSDRGQKRAVTLPAASNTQLSKLPRASEITVVEQKPQQTPRRLPASAPCDVCIYQYTIIHLYIDVYVGVINVIIRKSLLIQIYISPFW